MKEIRYMISDAAKMVDVEAHVLRYWEDELDLEVSRNEMGHRYYTEEDVTRFKYIKDLKNQGFQLKAIKMLLTEDTEMKPTKLMEAAQQPPQAPQSTRSPQVNDKMEQFQTILANIVSNVLKENNHELGKEVSSAVSENVLKEMDYLFRMQDEKDDERFKKFDETIRSYQKSRQEIAFTNERSKKKKMFRKEKGIQ